MGKNKAAQELGKLGGSATLKKHGKDYFKKLIEKRWADERKKKEALDK